MPSQNNTIKKDLVSIVILSFNTKKFTKKTIDSVLASTKHPFEIIVVDNASTDGSIDYLDTINNKYANLTIIKNLHFQIKFITLVLIIKN